MVSYIGSVLNTEITNHNNFNGIGNGLEKMGNLLLTPCRAWNGRTVEIIRPDEGCESVNEVQKDKMNKLLAILLIASVIIPFVGLVLKLAAQFFSEIRKDHHIVEKDMISKNARSSEPESIPNKNSVELNVVANNKVVLSNLDDLENQLTEILNCQDDSSTTIIIECPENTTVKHGISYKIFSVIPSSKYEKIIFSGISEWRTTNPDNKAKLIQVDSVEEAEQSSQKGVFCVKTTIK